MLRNGAKTKYICIIISQPKCTQITDLLEVNCTASTHKILVCKPDVLQWKVNISQRLDCFCGLISIFLYIRKLPKKSNYKQ